MRMVRCYECGKQYDYDDDGFGPKCGSFNQPARTAPAGSVRPKAGAAPAGAGRKAGRSDLQRELSSSLKQVEKAMDRLLKDSPPPRGRRLPGGER